jgi:hypothetical protein
MFGNNRDSLYRQRNGQPDPVVTNKAPTRTPGGVGAES